MSIAVCFYGGALVDDYGADLKQVDTPSIFLVLLHILVWIIWGVITGIIAIIGYPVVWFAVRSIDPIPKNEPLLFPIWARWWDSPVTTWPEPWWWEHQEQIERNLHREKFKTDKAYFRANLFHWRALRNPRNYFSRMVPREDVRDDVVQTRSSYTEDMFYVTKHHGDRYPTSKKTEQRYRWDSKRPWLGYWHRVQMAFSIGWNPDIHSDYRWWQVHRTLEYLFTGWSIKKDKYLNFRFGFKLAHVFVGMGFTVRIKYKDRFPPGEVT